ncbi:MAG: cobalamin-dependent protein [bacterium]|nr:cobalamin-dependent protein [bacterium]
MKNFNCALVHTPQLCVNKDTDSVFSNINFCAMGLYSLAKELEKEGFNSEIIHLGVEKYLNKEFLLSDYIKKNNIKFLAFSLHWHPQAYDVIETIRVVKEKCPNVFVSLGGFTSSYFAKEILETFPFIDAIIKGEGEMPMRKLAKKVYENDRNLSSVPNLFWRKNNEVVLNNEIFIATNEDLNTYEFFNIKKLRNYKTNAKMPFYLDYKKEDQLTHRPMSSQGVCLGRGCSGNCTWCGGGCEAMKLVTGRDFVSYRNADNVIEEIKMLKNECGIENFMFAFDPVPSDREHLIILMEKITQEFNGKLKTSFTLNSLPDKRFLDIYKNAFSKESTISISPEFYSEDLRRTHKSFFYSNNELEETLDYMEKLEIKSELYFSTLPMTTETDNLETTNYAKELNDKYKFVERYYVIPIVYEPAAPWTITPEKFDLSNNVKNFMDYYNDTKCVKNSFENINVFIPEKSIAQHK